MAISTFEADEIVARANVNQRINQANAYFPVSVANGGTGQTSLTSGNILLGNGTSGITSTAILPQSKGGTGVSSFYESGEWTPTIEKGAGSYLNRWGIYYRIGEMVFVNCYLQVAGTSSSSSYQVTIKGLPYNSVTKQFACTIGEARGLTEEPVTAKLYGSSIIFYGAVKSGDYYTTPRLVNNQWAYLNVSCWYKKA